MKDSSVSAKTSCLQTLLEFSLTAETLAHWSEACFLSTQIISVLCPVSSFGVYNLYLVTLQPHFHLQKELHVRPDIRPLKKSPFVFHRRKEVWNNMRASECGENVHFGVKLQYVSCFFKAIFNAFLQIFFYKKPFFFIQSLIITGVIVRIAGVVLNLCSGTKAQVRRWNICVWDVRESYGVNEKIVKTPDVCQLNINRLIKLFSPQIHARMKNYRA